MTTLGKIKLTEQTQKLETYVKNHQPKFNEWKKKMEEVQL